MANKVNNTPPEFRKGEKLLASDLNRLSAAAVGRIVGGGGIVAQPTKKGIAIVAPNRRQGKGSPDVIVVELGAPYTEPDAEEGEYEFTLYKGPGPQTGRAIEIMGREGLPAGLRVIARLAAGIWYFSAYDVGVRYGITAIANDTLTVKLLENSTQEGAGLVVVPDAPEIVIWKAWELQVQSFNTFTIDGVTYSSTGSQSRTGTEGATSENQIITPPYVTGPPFRSHSVVVASIPANGAAPSGPANRMMDENRAGRAWSKEATA